MKSRGTTQLNVFTSIIYKSTQNIQISIKRSVANNSGKTRTYTSRYSNKMFFYNFPLRQIKILVKI